jgi:hypothetical protein
VFGLVIKIMKRKKPDFMIVLVLLTAIGVVAGSYSFADSVPNHPVALLNNAR